MKTTLLFLSVLLSFGLFGQVVSFVTNDSIIIGQADSTILDYIDVNQDGSDDFELRWNSGWFAITGIYDSSDVYHDIYEFPNGSLIFAYSTTDSTISEGTSWYNNNTNTALCNLYSTPFFVHPYTNSSFYIGFRFLIQDGLIYQTHYGCMALTCTLDNLIYIHGWSYEKQPDTPIICSDAYINSFNSQLEIESNPKNLIQILDMMGRETSFKPNTPLIYVYDDGTTEKVFSVDY